MKKHRAYAVFLILVITVVVLVTIALSAVTYLKGRSNADVSVLSASQQYAQVFSDKVIVGFDADTLHVADGKLDGNLTFVLPEGVRSKLVDTASGKPIFTDCKNICTLARDQNAKFSVNMTVSGADGRPNADILKTFTFNDINGNTDGTVIPVTIPITSFPNNYPDDSYRAGVEFEWSLPDSVSTKSGNTPDTEYDVSGGNVTQNFDSTITHNTTFKSLANQSFWIKFTRTTPTVIYIFVAALIPLILALIFAHLLFFSRHAESRSFEEYAEALIVTVVAVLPLRLVIVPAELTGLTHVDLVLGLGLIGVVAIAGIKYGMEVWHGVPEHHDPHPERVDEEVSDHAAQPVPVAE